MTLKIEDLKCCGNCRFFSVKVDGQCCNKDGVFADPFSKWVCCMWQWDELTNEERK